MSEDQLITRHRPKTLADVIGHASVIKSLEGVIKRKDSQVFLFSGPPGTGKTTLAHIVARMLGCDGAGQKIEVPAAMYTGIDDVRRLVEGVAYKSFTATGNRCVILDEAHRLSKNAWDGLLIATENPPPYVFWFFCTTNLAKVPKAIVTRSVSYVLKPVSDDLIHKLVESVAKKEGIKLNGTQDLIVRESFGSPRQALANLAVCRDAPDRKTAAELLKTSLETDPIRMLGSMLVNGQGATWEKAAAQIAKLSDDESEGVRIVLCNYIAACLKNAKGEKQVMHLLSLLDKFAVPYNQAEGQAPLYLSVGRALFGG